MFYLWVKLGFSAKTTNRHLDINKIYYLRELGIAHQLHPPLFSMGFND